MATLKYRDSNGNFIAIPAVPGPKGDAGLGVQTIENTVTSTASSGKNTVKITLTDGTFSSFDIYNGAKGDKGDTGLAGGILDVEEGESAGYITVTNADSTTKQISVGVALSIAQDSVNTKSYVLTSTGPTDMALKYSAGVYVNCSTGVLYGAAWNDYAEFRDQSESIKPGYVVYCDDDGKVKKTTEKLQKFEGVVSDTYGFSIGETDTCKTPLAVSGRVLVYADPEEEHFHSGDCVCAGPDGLAYRMTREEIIQFPDRIVGIVSEIPTYETWGASDVPVNGRIWIKVR